MNGFMSFYVVLFQFVSNCFKMFQIIINTEVKRNLNVNKV